MLTKTSAVSADSLTYSFSITYSEEKLGLLCSADIHMLHPKRKQAEDTWFISSLNPLCF